MPVIRAAWEETVEELGSRPVRWWLYPGESALLLLPSAVCLGGSRHHSALLLDPSEGRERKLYRVPGHSVLVGKEGRDEKGRGTELTLLKNTSELR